ncbi:MAG: ABC transporter permease, partial [Gemmatimonadetes bacterium]|nr:ABC transporter permease [Gemmatimonadota bacterium]
NLVGDGPPELVNAVRVTPNMLQLLGRGPLLGRDFAPDEVGEGNDRVVILTDGFWARRFSRNPETVGRTLLLDGIAHIVIGVLPEDFVFLDERPDLFLPLPVNPQEAERDGHYAMAVARLSDGSTAADAEQELTRIAAQLEVEYPETNEGWTVDVYPARDEMLGDVAGRAAKVLLGAVLFVLLMACVNVANLLLAKGRAREREMAVRSALGAPQARVLRQLLTESLTLAFAGGVLGLVIGIWGSRAISAALPSTMPPVFRFDVDGTVLVFVTTVTLVAAIVFGLSPAVHLVRSSADALRGGGRHGRGGAQSRFGSTLVVVQTTLAMVLLVGGGLLMKSIAGMRNQDFGYEIRDVFTVRVSPPASDYPETADRLALWADIERRVNELPGITAAGTTQSHPLMGSNWGNTIRMPADPTREVTVRTTYASPGYFAALGIRPLHGRVISESDGQGSASVAVVNEAFVERYLGADADPLASSIPRGGGEDAIPIVGVIPNMVERGVDAPPEPSWYLHPDQRGVSSRSIVARVTGSPEEALSSIQQAVWSVDPKLPVYRAETLEALVAQRLGGFVLIASLMAGFAILSLILGAVGIYGVTAFSAGQRGQEIGLRKALGAEEGQVVSMVVRGGAWRAGAGLVLGFIAAAGVARLLGSILVGVEPFDPEVFFSVAGVLAAVSVLGLWIPARRAATVDPVEALSAD